MDFLDASALVKNYIAEAHSDKIVALLARTVPACARLGIVEVGSALARREREGELGAADRRQAADRLRVDALRLHLVDLSAPVANRALEALERHALRASDAIQLASALVLRDEIGSPVTFWCFDLRLAEAAERENFLLPA